MSWISNCTEKKDRQSLSDVLSHLGAPDPNSYDNLLEKHEQNLIKDTQAETIWSKMPDVVSGEAFNMRSCLTGLVNQGHVIADCQHLLKSLDYHEIHSREQMIKQAHDSTYEWIFHDSRLGFADWAANKNGTCKTHSIASRFTISRSHRGILGDWQTRVREVNFDEVSKWPTTNV